MKKEISAEDMEAIFGELSLPTKISQQSELGKPTHKTILDINTEDIAPKRVSTKQRKASFEEYQDSFLKTPKIINRKTVFISENLRDQVDEIARKLGDRKMSVSGFLENLVTHHLKVYSDDLEAWKKL